MWGCFETLVGSYRGKKQLYLCPKPLAMKADGVNMMPAKTDNLLPHCSFILLALSRLHADALKIVGTSINCKKKVLLVGSGLYSVGTHCKDFNRKQNQANLS